MNKRKRKTATDTHDISHPGAIGRREALARLGKYGAYTAPALIVLLGANKGRASDKNRPGDHGHPCDHHGKGMPPFCS